MNACAIQNFAFDFGSRHRLRAHGLDGELVTLLFDEVSNGADEHASADEKLLLRSFQARSLPPKIGPIRSLPVPSPAR